MGQKRSGSVIIEPFAACSRLMLAVPVGTRVARKETYNYLKAKEAHMGKQLDLRKQELRKNAAKVPSVRYLAQRFIQLQRLRQQVHAAEKGQAAGRLAQVSAGPV